MIVEDRYGNVYKINTPSYQAGGLVLPQYSGSQVTIQPPQSNLLNVPVNNDWNRGMQMDQLNMQREAAAANTVNTIMDNRIKMQTQERLNKQMDLQNKRLEWEQMKEGAKVIEETLKLSKDNLLGPDSAKFDELLKEQGYGADKIAGESDIMQIFKNRNAVNGLLYQQKQGLSNKANFIEMNKVLDDTDKLLKRADEVADLGYLKEEVRDSLLTSATALRKKQMGLANGTNGGWDIYSDPDYLNVTSGISFVDDAEYKLISDTKQKEAEANRRVRDINAEVDMIEAENKRNLIPSTISLNTSKAVLAEAQAKEMLDSLPTTLKSMEVKNKLAELQANMDIKSFETMLGIYDKYLKENPNSTATEQQQFFNKLKKEYVDGSKTEGPLSVAELFTESYKKGDEDGMQAAMDFQTANNNKTTDVNYTYPVKDAAGNTIAITNKEGITDYGSHRVDKDKKFIDGTYGGRVLTREQLEAAGATIHDDGSIDIKQSKLVNLIPAISSKGNILNSNNIKEFFGDTNATMIKDAWGLSGQADNLWTIKGKGPLPQQQTAQGGASGVPFYKPTTPAIGGSTGSNVVNKYYPQK